MPLGHISFIFGAGLVEASVVYTHAPLVIFLHHEDRVGKPFWKENLHNEAGCQKPGYLLSNNPSFLLRQSAEGLFDRLGI